MAAELLPLILKANLAGGAAILLILVLRGPAARRFGAGCAYALWWMAPLAALAALLPARRVVVETPAVMGDAAAVAALAGPAPQASEALTAAPLDPAPLLLGAWAAGVLLWLALLALRQRRFHRTLGPLTPEAGLWRAQATGVGPALIGALRPRIILPADFEARFDEGEREIVLAHEQAHLSRGDHLVNGAVALMQALNWFNPLVHLAASRIRIDQELACDAAVLARRPAARRSYAEAMLKTQLSPLAPPLGCHWPARASHPLKLRIAMLAQTPSAARRTSGLGLAGALSLVVAAAAWAAQPPQAELRTVYGPTIPGVAPPVTNPEPVQMAERPAPPARAAEPAPQPRAFDGPPIPLDHAAYETLGRALVRAAMAGEVSTAQALVRSGADVNFHAAGDGAPLLEAARRGHLGVMRVLLEAGANVDQPSPGDGNALIRAAMHGQMAAAQMLVEHGADVNAFVPSDETPLINASRSGDLAMVQFLVAHGADVSRAVPAHNWGERTRSPLSVTSDPRIAAFLKSRGARS